MREQLDHRKELSGSRVDRLVMRSLHDQTIATQMELAKRELTERGPFRPF